MEYDIRPLSFGEILDRSFRVLMDNALVLIAIAAVLLVPVRLMMSGGRIMFFVAEIAVLAAGLLVHAALVHATTECYLGQTAAVEQSYRFGWSIYWPFIGTFLLAYLVPALAVVVPMVVVGVLIAKTAPSPALAILIGVAAGAIVFFIVIRWSLIGPIMIVERRYGRAAMKRSSALVKGAWWRTLGILLAAGLIIQVPAAVLGLIWNSIPILGAILTGLTSAIGSAYSTIVLVLYYFDRRCRVEDFDLKRLAEQVRAESTQFGPSTPGVPTVG
ncbi:MAG TPA: hypothetical protein VMA09_22180 [Candidatus Binataceae bacterium]|nr:hypothetical protein [Candidatus Binataceae bacterium]